MPDEPPKNTHFCTSGRLQKKRHSTAENKGNSKGNNRVGKFIRFWVGKNKLNFVEAIGGIQVVYVVNAGGLVGPPE